MFLNLFIKPTTTAIILLPNQKFFSFCPTISPPPPLLNVGEVMNPRANPQPYNIKNRREGEGKFFVFGLFDNILFFWPHIFAIAFGLFDHKLFFWPHIFAVIVD